MKRRVSLTAILFILFSTISIHARDTRAADSGKDPDARPLPLITSGSQISSNANTDNTDLSKLIDENDASWYWLSDTAGVCKDEQYIQVDLGENKQWLAENENILLYVRRHPANGTSTFAQNDIFAKKLHPTIFKVEVSEDGEQWVAFADVETARKNYFNSDAITEENVSTHVFLTYRGPSTREISEPIHTNRTFRYVRFTVLANNSKTLNAGSDTNRSMCLSDFQLYKINDKCQGLYYFKGADGKETGRYLVDRFHLNTDYRYDYKDYQFVNTRGILDLHKQEYGGVNTDDLPADFCDWDACWDENGLWKKDHLTLAKYGIEMPKYSFVTGAEDPDIKEGVRQRTHTIEHTYYAVPGEAVALMPYYEMPTVSSEKYDITYAHWYDMKTGGHLRDGVTQSRLLDFLVDPSQIYYSEKYGYFAGMALPRTAEYDPIPGTGDTPVVVTDMEINSIEDWNAFIEAVKNNGGINAKLMADLDFTGQEFKPIEVTQWPSMYYGTFDGQGHTVKGIDYSTNKAAFITNIGNNSDGTKSGCLKNIVFDESCHFSGTNSAGIVGMVSGLNAKVEITGIVSKATISVKGGWSKTSGLVADMGNADYNKPASLNISNCAVIGDITSRGPSDLTGAIFVINAINTTITGCWSVTGVKHEITDWTDNLQSESTSYNWTTQADNANVKITNCYAKTTDGAGDGVIAITAEDINTEAFVEMLNGGDTGYWTVSEEGSSTYPYPSVKTSLKDPTEPEEPEITYDDKPGMYDWSGVRSTDCRPLLAAKPDELTGHPGTYATFFMPRNPYSPTGQLRNLPNEYVIAADFSLSFNVKKLNQEFDPNLNIDYKHRKIYEPELCYRHIFYIKDGRAFADEMSGSYENNQKYVKKTRRNITSLIDNNDSFKIRLEGGMPSGNDRNWDARSRYYYKISDTDYRRVASVDLDVKKIVVNDDGSETEVDLTYENAGDMKFTLGKTFKLVGSRMVEGDKYFACGGNAEVYRMLMGSFCRPGKYVVRMVAKDVNGNHIHPYGDTEHDLIVRELVITLIDKSDPDKIGYMCTEEELAGKEYGTVAALERKFGAPAVTVDFDEYMAFNKMLDKERETNSGLNANDYIFSPWETRFGNDQQPEWDGKAFALKWPLPRHVCDYGSTLGRGHNYNTYRVAQHSSVVEWKASASTFSNNYGGAKGLFDRHYYDTWKEIEEAKKKATEAGVAYTGPEEPEMGYFYWVNASSDPGVTNSLNLGKLCSGATLHITAWMAEFSGGSDVANTSFNFVGVSKNGERNTLHSFVTQDIPANGEWHKIYFQFTPDFEALGINAADIDHYEIELENNAGGSEVADYAIDNVQVYIIKSDIKAKQLSFPCDDKDKVSDLLVYAPFENLLKTIDMEPAEEQSKAEDVKLYYTFLDKDIYDSTLASSNDVDKAFKAAQMKGCYGEDNNAPYGTIDFTTYYDGLSEYKYEPADKDTYGVAMKDLPEDMATLTSDKVDFLGFNCEIRNDNLRVGKDYYVLLFNRPGYADGEEFVPTAADFKVEDECASKCVVRIQGSTLVKVDGYFSGDGTDIRCCENQTPVVQLNLNTLKDENGEQLGYIPDAAFDWYLGSVNEYYEAEDGDGNLLHEALAHLRDAYPHTDTADMPVNGTYTEQDKKHLLDLTSSRDGKSPVLFLYQRSFMFPETALNGQEERVIYVTAIPVDLDRNDEEIIGPDGEATVIPENARICLQPVELTLTVSSSAPRTKSGITALTYPDYITDTPVRVGLEQISKAMAASKEEAKNHRYTLDFPLRYVSSTNPEVKKMEIDRGDASDDPDNTATNDEVFLSETNDPEYRHLQKSRAAQADPEEMPLGLWPVGYLKELRAEVNVDAEGKVNENITDNMARIVFYNGEEGIQFKEGYYYRFVVPYKEEVLKDDNGEQLDYTPACQGRQVVTLKVVPKYVKWTAGDTDNLLNWNKDTQWRRVAYNELYADKESDEKKEGLAEYVTDGGENDNVNSYSPAPWTKVLIPVTRKDVAGDEGDVTETDTEIDAPYLYEPAEEKNVTFAISGGSATRAWTSDPSAPQDTPAGVPNTLVDLLKRAMTYDIEYDMVAFEPENAPFLACGPWQAHVCDEIDFLPAAGISNQQYLNYNRAWVEFELTPGRWYTLASPLQATLAGDMYMPSRNARQETLRFEDITYDVHKNHRFAPAVFQRSWNKASAMLHKLPGADLGEGGSEDVAVSTTWSHVYNEVNERYTAGAGFSIYADVTDSRVTDFDASENAGKTLMRLPKADTEWYYYDIDWKPKDDADSADKGAETTGGGIHGDYTKALRPEGKNNYRLNDVEGKMNVSAMADSKYFLVGNPFMTTMDMHKFLEKNADKIEPKYWVVAQDKETADADAVVVGGGESIETAIDTDTHIAPLQGFFVELKSAATTLELDYDADMMLQMPRGGERFRKRTRGGEPEGMRILAVSNDTTVMSRALLRLDDGAGTGYGPEDAALLLDPVMMPGAKVYTTAGGVASMINSTCDAEGVEVGMVNSGDMPMPENSVIRFENTGCMEGYMLTDLTTGETSEIYEGMELPVDGSVSGRYFITRGLAGDELTSMRVSREGNKVTVTTGRDHIEAEMYDMPGRCLESRRTEGRTLTLTLPSGVTVLRVTDGVERRVMKLIAR